ncbi:MAG: universal stress protein [Burkholderiales bacterium]|jgi:nucleotide-binding universal stress UspA family protein|nr:universal stress protein [Burkholderiales bacterium]
MFKHILIPTDGSEISRRAIAGGIGLAKAVGARVTALYAAPTATPVVYKHFLPVGYTTPEKHAKAIKRAAAHYLGVAEAAAKAAGVPCETVFVTDDFPANAILAAAKKGKCDLIYMASHGHRGVSAVLLGSETQKVLTGAKIPVLVHR